MSDIQAAGLGMFLIGFSVGWLSMYLLIINKFILGGK
jgi:hypothetical protein